jgi:hypothetical protein
MKSIDLISTFSLIIALSASIEVVAAQDAGSGKQAIVQKIQEHNIRICDAQIAKGFVNFQMSPAWWSRMTASDGKGVKAVEYVTRGIGDFGKQMGWGDLSPYDDSSSGTLEEKRQRIQEIIDGWKGKVSVTFKAESPTCDSIAFDLAMRYLTAVGEELDSNDWQPPSGVAEITLVATDAAKDITVKTLDGKHFVVSGPVKTEPTDWGSKITAGFKRLGKGAI